MTFLTLLTLFLPVLPEANAYIRQKTACKNGVIPFCRLTLQ